MNGESPTAETQSAVKPPPEPPAAKPLSADQLAALHAIWKQIDAGRGDDRPSREARLDFCAAVIKRPLATTKDLSREEAQQVIQAMKQETGQEWRPPGAGWRGRRRKSGAIRARISAAEQAKIGALAADLWGERWNEMLAARCQERFRVASLNSLTPRSARQLVEELLQRVAVIHIANRHQPPIARAEIEAEKEILRKRYFTDKKQRGENHGELQGTSGS